MTITEWETDVENELVPETPVAELRDWARGSRPITAATELLIRGGWAQTRRPWVRAQQGIAQGYWIDFESIHDYIGGLSGGERRFLLLAVSLAEPNEGVSLEDAITGIDHAKVDLVLAALAHAAGADHLHAWPDPQ